MKKVLLLFLISFSALSSIEINTLHDFRAHIRIHRLNVARIGSIVIEKNLTDEALRQYLLEFENIEHVDLDFSSTRRKFKKKIVLHDASKEIWNISEKMFKNIGGVMSAASVKKINDLDEEISRMYDEKSKMLPWESRLFNALELMIDLVERERNEVTPIEFGREIRDASHQLKHLADGLPDGNVYEQSYLIDKQFNIKDTAQDLYDSTAIFYRKSGKRLSLRLLSEGPNHFPVFLLNVLKIL